MTFKFGGSGRLKSPTALLEGQTGYLANQWSAPPYFVGGLKYDYSASSVATGLNVTGSGVIQFLSFGSDSTSSSGNMTVTIDGVEVLDDTRGAINNMGIVPIGGIYQAGTSLTASLGYVPFNSSLVVTVQCNVAAYLSYNYYLT